MIKYYGELCATAEKRKKIAEDNLKKLISTQLDVRKECEEVISLPAKETTSSETFYTALDEETQQTDSVETKPLNDNENLDIINANTENKLTENLQLALDNFAMAKQIKRKVMAEEMGIYLGENIQNRTEKPTNMELTAAQRNKIKVLSSEFDIEVNRNVPLTTARKLTDLEQNKMNVMSSNECFYPQTLDNANYLNKNQLVPMKRSLSLVIKKDTNRCKLMSVDSTPLSDCTTPSTLFQSSIDTNQPTTAETQATDDGGSVVSEQLATVAEFPFNFKRSTMPKARFSRYLTPAEVKSLIPCNVLMYLKESIQVPLRKHRELIDIELKRYFIHDKTFLTHLKYLRDYFFLCDGNFARNITESLFEKLYFVDKPLDLINIKALYHLLNEALLDTSTELNEFSKRLSFKINKIPIQFDLGDPDVLKCVTLTYKIDWPLNILLPSNIMGKYNQVFMYLLKLNRVAWALKKIFLNLKLLAKETGTKGIYLMMSPQYRKIHQCRHVMLHCIQCLQCYFVGEVLQNSWAKFEQKLAMIQTWEDIYEVHNSYIRDVLSQ